MNKAYYAILVLMISSCKYDQVAPAVDCSLEGPTLTLVQKEDANCGEFDGSITLLATGGDGNYSFSSSGLKDQTSPSYAELSAGNYEFVVRDGNLCTSTLQAVIGNIGGVEIASVATVDAGCSTINGSIVINATNGSPPYTYQVDDGTGQANNAFSNLSAATYSVKVTDSDGCDFTQEVLVSSGISFSTSITSIISNNCAISGCHAGDQFPDFRVFANIQENASRIKQRVTNKSMPIGRTLTQTQIAQIVCWIDDGALDN